MVAASAGSRQWREELAAPLRRGLLRAKREGWTEWIRSERDEHAVAHDCWFDLRQARRVQGFFRTFLRHSKGRFAGQSFDLLEWQFRELVGPLFGWRRKDGTRRFRRCYVEVPKKNGKSTLMAGVALYMLVADGEQGAEVYTLAGDRDQAAIIFNEAVEMVDQSLDLRRHLEVIRSRYRITFPRMRSFFRVLSSDARRKHGFNPHCTIFDELHTQPNRSLWEAFENADIQRAQPLHLSITTAGDDDQSICFEQHEYARQLIEGLLWNWEFLPLIYAAPLEADWRDEATWRLANPSYGITVTRESFASRVAEVAARPRAEPTFRRDRLNQWVRAKARWFRLEPWDECRTPWRLEDFAGETCWLGLDMSARQDLTALAIVFVRNGRWWLRVEHWAPEARAAERQARGVTWETWSREGHLSLVPGEVIDQDLIRGRIEQLATQYHVQRIVYDPWNAGHLATQLESSGLEIVEFPQQMRYFAAPTQQFEEAVLTGKLAQDGCPLLRWQIDLVQPQEDASGNKRPAKNRSRDRIDGVVAAIMALSQATDGPATLSEAVFA